MLPSRHPAKCFMNSCIFFLLCLHFGSCTGEYTLQYLQILYRHGDRAPIHLYPKDPNPVSRWPEGLAKLTKLGREQHYKLGQYFHNRYQDFITTSPDEIDVQSSDVDRCLKSALTNLATFYKPSEKWTFQNGVDWQPITVLFIPKDDDKYLEVDSICPQAFEEKKRIIDSPKGREINDKYKDMYGNLTVLSGKEIETWIDAAYFSNTLEIERRYNLTIPASFEPYLDQLRHIEDMSFYWSFNTTLMRRLRVGPLFGKIVDNFQKVTRNQNGEKKVQVFSAHDTNVALVMQALNVANLKRPPYCSTIIFELHLINETYSVRLLFMNSTAPEIEIEEPHLLVLKDCSEFCPLDFFINFTSNMIPVDWEAECRMEPSFFEKISKTSITVPVVFTVLAVGIIVLSTYSVWKSQFRAPHRSPVSFISYDLTLEDGKWYNSLQIGTINTRRTRPGYHEFPGSNQIHSYGKS